MVYRVIGTMSGSSLDGLDIAFVELQETSGKWTYELRNSACYEYPQEWIEKLTGAPHLRSLDYQLLHTEYGHYTGELINRFIRDHDIQYQVQLIASHGHTTFHVPSKRMTAQLGCGAAIAAETGINVVSDLRAMDIALGGQGAPIVPIGEKLLLGDAQFFLNLGGIANISINLPDRYIAYDVCPANRVLNILAKKRNHSFDDEGRLAAEGHIDENLLSLLNELEYYSLPYPKSLSNDFGTDVIVPLITGAHTKNNNDLRTYVEHISFQVARSVKELRSNFPGSVDSSRMLVTGGGAKNKFLVQMLAEKLSGVGVTLEIPQQDLIDYKEAIVMALIGVLRWREEYNTLASVTGATRNSIGGAVWMGLEA
jgi:anhydro-N-acetylmuramic acid kinase